MSQAGGAATAMLDGATESLMGQRTNRLSISRRALLRRLAVASSPLAEARFPGLAGGIPADRRAAAQAPTAPTMLTVATNRTPSDLDPHSAYDDGSGVV